ncbi:MAG: hypothetical protein EKK45_20865 [Curvibacter sp.]|nr:MAG: hypothetical protein EKK45_20865 [Curvibacter sp.]
MDALTKQYFDPTTVSIQDQTDKTFTSWFDGDLNAIARLSGAPKQSTITVSYWKGIGFELVATGPFIRGDMVRRILQHEHNTQPPLFIQNVVFELPVQLQRRKIGVRSLAIELHEAKRIGQFAHVAVSAAGNASTLNPEDPSDYLNGYLVWPLLGFDGPIPAHKLPEFHPHHRVSQVLTSPGGALAWARKGDYCQLQFDLAAGSSSWIVLNRYLRDNHIEVTP